MREGVAPSIPNVPPPPNAGHAYGGTGATLFVIAGTGTGTVQI